DGSLRWSVDVESRAPRPLALLGDGRLEFLVSTPNSHDVSLLDCKGNVVWTRALGSDQTGTLTLDTDGDGKRELLFVDGKGLQVVTSVGEHVPTTAPPQKGFVNRLQEVHALPGMDRVRLIVGAYVERKEQHYWGYTERLECLGALTGREPFFDSVPADPA